MRSVRGLGWTRPWRELLLGVRSQVVVTCVLSDALL